jgi:hypothetical protein
MNEVLGEHELTVECRPLFSIVANIPTFNEAKYSMPVFKTPKALREELMGITLLVSFGPFVTKALLILHSCQIMPPIQNT